MIIRDSNLVKKEQGEGQARQEKQGPATVPAGDQNHGTGKDQGQAQGIEIPPHSKESLGIEGHVLWWALSLGACLGGNGSLIGASANVVAAGISERTGHPIKFIEFLKVGMPVTIITVGLATIYVLLILA